MGRHLLGMLRARAGKRAHSLPVTSGIGSVPDLLERDLNGAAGGPAGAWVLLGAQRHGVRELFQRLNADTGPPRKYGSSTALR
jgi:hypothetical protein